MEQILQFIAALDPSQIVKDAYDKDFRWWFLCLLGLVLSGGLWALRYLLSQAKEQQITHSQQIAALVNELSTSRQHHHDRIANMQTDALNMVREVISMIASCKVVIESNTRESEKVRMAVEKWDRDHGGK